ncbi:hypothetical protein KUF54_03850 [Comamonas sp. Y33R10-2]|nr:hypothetical protein KUF54_03850 [Comamonas sp. Y33R10-2]
MTALLTGCLIPERFTAKVDVHPDASFSYLYKGTAVDAMGMMKLRKQGSLSDKDHQGMTAQAQKMQEDPDVKKVVYNGKARFSLEISGTRAAGESLRLLDMFSVQTDQDGVMTIAAKPLKEKEKNDLSQLGINLNGKLTVHLPSNVEVISQNANSAPILGIGSYSWKIGGLGVRPEIKLRFMSSSKP